MTKFTRDTKENKPSALPNHIKKKLPDSKASKPSGQNPSALDALFLNGIMDMYWAENHLVKALPKMVNAAGSGPLKTAFADHLQATMEHVSRLEQVFKLLGAKARAKKCDAMDGLTMEGEGIMEETEEGTTARDIGLIMAGRKVEHYEMSSYSGLISLAAKSGKEDISKILEKTLQEEIESEELLSNIADQVMNNKQTPGRKK